MATTTTTASVTVTGTDELSTLSEHRAPPLYTAVALAVAIAAAPSTEHHRLSILLDLLRAGDYYEIAHLTSKAGGGAPNHQLGCV